MCEEDVNGSAQAALDLHRLINGYRITQAIHVAAVLGVADQMGTNPRPVAEIAAAVGAHSEALYRLLRALAAVGVFREHADRCFSITAMGASLRSDSLHPVRPHAVVVGQSNQWDAWGQLLHSVRTGENAFDAVHGMGVWDYRARYPDQGELFHAAMTGYTRRAEQAIVAACDDDLARITRIADIGGGQGSLLAALLQANAHLRGVLFDLPQVVAAAAPVLAAAGVADRVEAIGGDMRIVVPGGCDAYVLKHVIHDWDDAQCLRILRSCRAAMTGDARLIVIERLLGPPNEGAEAKLADLQMLVVPGGQERTLDEFTALFETAGLRVAEVRPTRSPDRLIVVERA